MQTQEALIQELRHLYELEKRYCEESYFKFFQRAWAVMEPYTPLVPNWHIEYLCNILQEEIERIAERKPKTKDINLNIPPRSGKSYIVSIMLCPWAWTRFPHLKFIFSSHSLSLSIDHCVKGRRLIESEWYQRHWNKVFKLAGDQNVKSYYENDQGGARFATSVTGGITGHGADFIGCDDLLDPLKAQSELSRKAAHEHYRQTLYTRLNDQKTGVRVIVNQRLHEEDITGIELNERGQQYQNICIPGEYDADLVSPKSLKKHYKKGLFFPERFSRKVLEEYQKALGSVGYAGQVQQSPSAQEGNLFLRKYWNFYQVLPEKFDEVIQSWDLAFKEKEQNDYTVGQVWGKKGANCYLIAQFRAKAGIKKSVQAILQLTQDHPKARRKFVEDKANGPALIDLLKGEVAGIIPVQPKGDKVSRANAILYLVEAGNVYLPDPKLYSWVNEFIEELAVFPNGTHDDQVDAMTQALSKMAINATLAKYRRMTGWQG